MTRKLGARGALSLACALAVLACRVNPTSPDLENTAEGKACPPDAKIEDGEDNNNQVLVQDGRSGYIYTYADPEGTSIEPACVVELAEAGDGLRVRLEDERDVLLAGLFVGIR